MHRSTWLLVPAGLAIAAGLVRVLDRGPDVARGPRAAAVLQLRFPPAWAGHTVELRLQRVPAAVATGANGRDAATAHDGFVLSPRVRDDGSLPIAGLAAGSWRVRAVEASSGRALAAEVELQGSGDVLVPLLDEPAGAR